MATPVPTSVEACARPAMFAIKSDTPKRIQKVIRMRLAGNDWATISKAIGCESDDGAYGVWKRWRDKLPVRDIEHLRDVQGERLEAMIKASWRNALKGDGKAVGRVLKAMDMINNLYGLNAPAKVDLRVLVREIAERNDLDPDEAVRYAEKVLAGA